jgi:hypothetical protein
MTEQVGKYIDLDAFVPPLEPSWVTIFGNRYDVVDEISTGTFMRIVKLEELQGEVANENLIAIFQEAIPTLPREVIVKMTAPQLTGCLAFLEQLYVKSASDPNRLRPMLKQISA